MDFNTFLLIKANCLLNFKFASIRIPENLSEWLKRVLLFAIRVFVRSVRKDSLPRNDIKRFIIVY